MLSGAPYGYRYHKKTPDSDAFYEIVEAQACVVRDVYRHYTEDHMSIGAIARKLNERGVPHVLRGVRAGNARWCGRCCAIRRTREERASARPARRRASAYGLCAAATGSPDATVVGHERPREDWIEIPVPAIVGEETFAIAEERLQRNKVFSRRRTKTPSLSQGLVACGKCGYGLYRTSAQTSARKISYYRCLGSDSWRHLNGALVRQPSGAPGSAR